MSDWWAHICMTGQAEENWRSASRKTLRALDTASSSGQSNETAAGKPLPVFPTLKKNVRSAPSNAASCGARELAETREGLLKKEALEEMFAASRKRFLAIARGVLRSAE